MYILIVIKEFVKENNLIIILDLVNVIDKVKVGFMFEFKDCEDGYVGI